MTSVLRPVGPEPAWIYWLRRTMILGVGLIVVVAGAAVEGAGTLLDAIVFAASVRERASNRQPA